MMAELRVNPLQRLWLREIGIEKTWLRGPADSGPAPGRDAQERQAAAQQPPAARPEAAA
ncbi:hypothetical protein L537_3160, partial [Bordetella hinzii 1277]